MKTGKKIVLGSLLAVIPCVVVFIWLFYASKPLSSSGELTPRERLAGEIPTAVLLWSKDGMVTVSSLKKWNPLSITQGENPRWSPDGKKFVFTRDHAVWLMSNDFSKPVKLIEDVVTEHGTGAYWISNGDSILMIRRQKPQQVIKLELTSGKTDIIHDENRPPYKGYPLSQCAELRHNGRYLLTFTTSGSHMGMVVDLKAKRYISNPLMRDGDCEPAFAPDGSFIVNTRRGRFMTERPIYIADFDGLTGQLSASRYLIGKGRCHRSNISNDSKYILYTYSGNNYCWKVKAPISKPQHGIQLTFDGKSSEPNLYIYPKKPIR